MAIILSSTMATSWIFCSILLRVVRQIWHAQRPPLMFGVKAVQASSKAWHVCIICSSCACFQRLIFSMSLLQPSISSRTSVSVQSHPMGLEKSRLIISSRATSSSRKIDSSRSRHLFAEQDEESLFVGFIVCMLTDEHDLHGLLAIWYVGVPT